MKKIGGFAVFTTIAALLIALSACKNDGSTKKLAVPSASASSTDDTGTDGGGSSGGGTTEYTGGIILVDNGDTNAGDTGGDSGDTGGTDTTIPGGSGSTDSGTGSGTTTYPILRLAFTGDVMLARKVKTSVTNNGNGNYQYPFQYVADYLRTADFACVNLESIISNKGIANATKLLQGIAFRADIAAMNGLTFSGIDAVSLANNHAFDYGRSGFQDCMTRLTAAGIAYVGAGLTHAEAYAPKIFTVNGTRIALIGVTLVGEETTIRAQQYDAAQGLTAQSGVAWFYSKYVNKAIVSARENADVVVVMFHNGTEYESLPNSSQERFYHQCIDHGANLVIGHHPHVIEPVTVYHKGYIAYSLGNFIFDQSDTATKRGMVLEVLVQNKSIIQVTRKYVQINGTYQPVLQ